MNKQNYQENLPFFINGTLSDDDKADFEQALLNDASLKKDADFLMALRQQVKNEAVQSPGEMGLHRLKRDIKNQADTQKKVAKPEDKLSNKWRLFAVAASLMLVMQTGFMLTMSTEQDVFEPLSGAIYAENVLQIQFKDSAKASDINALLVQFKASIIEGPSKVGLYRVSFKRLNNDVVKKLQNNNDIIDFVAEE